MSNSTSRFLQTNGDFSIELLTLPWTLLANKWRFFHRTLDVTLEFAGKQMEIFP
jgi:hypothetical protein